MSMSSKPFTEIEEQIKILQKRALTITDIDDVRAKLLHHNYYTIINGYKYPFLSQDATEEKYIAGTSFNELFALYTFDCNFRALLLEYILKIEHQLKSVISHYFAKSIRTKSIQIIYCVLITLMLVKMASYLLKRKLDIKICATMFLTN